MKVLIVSSFVPFVHGGGRFIVDWLQEKLVEYGHEAEKIYLPFNEGPDRLLENILAYRLMDLSAHADRLVAIRPPSHSIIHPNKVVWFIHHLRGYYDLAETKYASAPDNASGRALRAALRRHDTQALNEARAVFTNSGVVRDRLQEFNGVSSEVLYPPLLDVGGFHNQDAGDEIVSICRLEEHKRQHLLIDAMRYVKTPVRLRICGKSASHAYEADLRRRAHETGVEDRIELEFGWISEAAKIERLSRALASAYAPLDEDSYGYPTLEAAASGKPTLTTWDAGGTLEFVSNGQNGYITDATPIAVADGFDRLYSDRKATAAMGRAAFETIDQLNISWDHVINRLLA